MIPATSGKPGKHLRPRPVFAAPHEAIPADPHEVRAEVLSIERLVANDLPIAARSAEARLHRRVLVAIARGCHDPRGMAAVALETLEALPARGPVKFLNDPPAEVFASATERRKRRTAH